ncbi:Disease resistance protein RPM1 [Citrus sinensis]|uniref:NB-ARC domain-containing protein n=1 Tax=Citrus unshiu TaxID=55188 RepID=A0A2H5QV07_CITUN|nr:putative disease resistance RPP13-like protein 2 [Citrus sinensis]KAH9763978.1 Disease resistance protein RPM1 [Citrus sinensis]GAY68468.1 hypothetical protein CUMW_264370 [Citrus unshiu]
MDEINCFTYESEKVIDTFINSITQQKSQSSCSKDICDALQGLQSRITDIKQRMQQHKHMDSEIIHGIKTFEAKAGISSSSKSRDTVGLDDRMEKLLDLLIEGPPQRSMVAILDSIGLDKTAFATEAYNSSYVKHYFDCHAWITEPYSNEYDADQILDIVIKFLMPSSRLSEIMDKNYEMKKIILHEYLMTKRYLIVIDDVWSIEISTRQLYQLWIAEGFILDNSEATTESYLEQLIKEGFAEAKKRKAGGTINTCSIPGRWGPLLFLVPSQVEFIFSPFVDGKSGKKALLFLTSCAYLKKMPEQLWCIKSLNNVKCWWPQPVLRQKLREFEDKEQYGVQLYPYGI